jgi:Ca2+-binding EF-hand superfamily protein
MGTCHSAPVGGHVDDEYEALGLVESDLKVFRDIFNRLDRRHEGLLEINVLLSVVDVEDCAITRQCFSFYDTFRRNGEATVSIPGKLHFKIFVLLLWNFCSLTVKAFGFQLFDMYDKDRKCVLITDDVVRLLTDLKVTKEKINGALRDCPGVDLFDHGRRSYDIDKWEHFCNKYTGFFISIAERQTKVKAAIGGLRLWDSISNRMFKNNSGINCRVNRFVEMVSTHLFPY